MGANRTITWQITGPVAAERILRPGVSLRIINKALDKDPRLRYQHASEMRADFQRLKRDTDTSRSVVFSQAPAHREPGATGQRSSSGAMSAPSSVAEASDSQIAVGLLVGHKKPFVAAAAVA